MAVARDGELPAVLRLRSRIERTFSSGEAQQLTALATGLFEKSGNAYAGGLGDDELMALVTGASSFLAAAGRLPRVRVFNPRHSTHRWEPPFTVVEVCADDRSFVLDVVRGHLRRAGLVVRHALHPTLLTMRERDGGLTTLRSGGAEGLRECFVHIAVDRIDDGALARIEASLQNGLEAARATARDVRRVRDRLQAFAQDLEWVAGLPSLRGRRLEVNEAVAFLRWLAAGNFVFLGYAEFLAEEQPGGMALVPVEEATLGGARTAADGATSRPGPAILRVAESTAENAFDPLSNVEEVQIQRLAPDGEIVGEGRFFGCFTSKAVAQEPAEVPGLRRTLTEILDAEGAVEGSHERKEITAIFNGFSKDELFRATAGDVGGDIRAVLSAGPGEVSITRRDRVTASGQRFFVLIGTPRDRIDAQTQHRVEELLVTRLGGRLAGSHLALGHPERACLHVAIDAPADGQLVTDDSWRREVSNVVRPWDEPLLEELGTRHPPAEAAELLRRFRNAFPPDHTHGGDIRTTVSHIGSILDLERTGAPQLTLHDIAAGSSRARREATTLARFYQHETGLTLVELLSILEHFGLRVLGDDSFTVAPLDGAPVLVHSIRLRERQGAGGSHHEDAGGTPHEDAGGARPDGTSLDLGRAGERVIAGVQAVRRGDVESDDLNRLALGSDLDWRAIDCLRALAGFAQQIGIAPERAVTQGALVDNPAAARALYQHFCARLKPEDASDPLATHAVLAARLEAVPRAADARLLGDLVAIVEAVVRTNVFRPPRGSTWYVALKFHGPSLDSLRPRGPLYEIYVHSARMEGLHLRLDRTARGSIAHLDSRDPLRPELLHRLVAQDLRNAMTTARGAAGGFVLKRTDAAEAAAIQEAYATLVRGLLDVTDNRAEAADEGMDHDEDDPYFVIAPLDGDPSFVDIANALATQYDFWLADAFAPAAFAARRVGIAARGAWECVQAHLRDAGRIIDEPVVVVGTGDMTDEFFGQGMLLSPNIELRAALSPRYIFLDPNPQPSAALAERQRLARNRLGWDAYDASKLGPGGMILPRNAKQIQPSPEVRTFLGVGDAEVSGEELTQSIIRAKADVLWGGSGGAREGDAGIAAGASSGGAGLAEVTGREVRAAVIADGASSGLGQDASVEYELAGGRTNTSVVDGAAGDALIDCEVNVKVLFQPLLDVGTLSRAERDEMLRKIGDEAAQHALAHISAEHRALSFDQARSREHLHEYVETMTILATDPQVAPALEGLPDRATLRARRAEHPGLTRPELGVLLACTKNLVKHRLRREHSLIDDASCEPFLHRAFPPSIAVRFRTAIRTHRLRREIIAAAVANQLVDTFGCTFIHRIALNGNADLAAITRAWVIAFTLIDGHDMLSSISSAASSAEIHQAVVASVERVSHWVLRHASTGQPSEVTRTLADRAAEPMRRLEEYLSAPDAELFHRRLAELEMMGLAPETARRLAQTEWLDAVLDITTTAADLGAGWENVARLYFGLSDWLEFPWLFARLAETHDGDEWERRSARGLAEDLAAARVRLVRRLLAAGAVVAGPDAPGLLREQARDVAALVADVRGAPLASAAALRVVVREIVRLAETG